MIQVPLWALLAAHAAVTWFLTGLIWFVQVVHYPLLAEVDGAAFRAYHAGHLRRVTLVVAPLMVAEAVLSLWLIAVRADAAWLVWTGAALLAAVWLATFGLSVPRHNCLAARGADPEVIRGLVFTNWVRTAAWTARAALAAWMLRSLARG
jgi:hypothetical protein